MEKGKNKLACF